MRIGCWLDEGPRETLSHGYIDEMVDSGIRVFYPVVTYDGHEIWSRHELSELCRYCISIDCEVGVTFWPNVFYPLNHVEYLKGIADTGIVAIETEVEGNWKGENTGRAFRSIAPSLITMSLDNDIRIEATTFPSHREFSKYGMWRLLCNRMAIQAYSRATINGHRIRHNNAIYGPGIMQKNVAKAAQRLNISSLVMGLAAYDQHIDNMNPVDAMRLSAEASWECGVEEIRYWSSKFIVGRKRSDYALPAIRSIANAFGII